MSNHKNVIEINGKQYDAKSGMLLSDITPVAASTEQPPIIQTDTPTQQAETPQLDTQPINSSRAAVTQPNPRKARQPQRSQTLMRRGVTKPVNDITPTKPTVNRFSNDKVRVQRVKAISKSPFINKYGQTIAPQPIKKTTAPLDVQPHPEYVSPPAQSLATAVVAASQPTQPQLSQSEKLFNDALERVDQDQQNIEPVSKKTNPLVKFGLGAAMATLIIGVVGYLNLPKINLKLANAQAGFSAILPANQLDGYHLVNQIEHATGKIGLSFKSEDGEANYKLSQEVSSWDSQSLQENFFAAQNKPFRTIQDGGKTIFLYDNSSATWVNGGIRYTITSNSLTSDQITSLANSL